MYQTRIQDTHWTQSVYPPSDDSFALVDAVRNRLSRRSPPRLCFEVGSGSGYVSTSLVLMLKSKGHSTFVLATDINPEAAECTKQTAKAHGIDSWLDVVITPFWTGIVSRNFDFVLFNPPYVPTPQEELLRPGIHAAWAGGRNGRYVIDQFLERLPEVLTSPESEAILVTIDANFPEEILTEMQSRGYSAEVTLKRRADQERLFVLSLRGGCSGHGCQIRDT